MELRTESRQSQIDRLFGSHRSDADENSCLKRKSATRFLRGFQFHLSTALVCIFVAGELLYLNTIQRKSTTQDAELYAAGYWPDYGGFTVELGWPITCAYVLDREYANCKALQGQPYPFWNTWGVVVDGLVAIAIVGATAVVLEWILVRRIKRELKRKTDAT